MANKKIGMYEWRKAGDFEKAAEPGDEVELDVVRAFIDALPPATLAPDLIQSGESYSYALDPETGYWRDTYTTFKRKDGRWIYCGHCFRGKTQEPKRFKVSELA